MLITHYNVKDTFLSKKSYEQIIKRFHNFKTFVRIFCDQTNVKLLLEYNATTEEIIGRLIFRSTSTEIINLPMGGVFIFITFIIYKNNDYIYIENPSKLEKPDLIDIVIYLTEHIIVNGNIITSYMIKKNLDNNGEYFQINESYIKDLHKKMNIQNFTNLKNICVQTFTKKRIKTTKQIPLFKESGIDENGKMKYTQSRILTPRKIKNPHELTNTFRPETLKKLNSSSSTIDKMSRKRIDELNSQERKKMMNLTQSQIYKLRYGTKLDKNRFKTKTIKKKSSSSKPSIVDNANIGLLIITTHGTIMYNSNKLGNLKIIPIPIEIKNTYYRSYSKPGLYVQEYPSTIHSPDVSPTNDSDDIYKYEGATSVNRFASIRAKETNKFLLSDRRKRSIYEPCFKDTNDKLKFYKYFFNCGLDYIVQTKKELFKKRRINPHDEDDTKREMGDIVDNGKVNYLLNKLYTVDGPTQKITFIFYNTEDKKYNKYNLFSYSDFEKFCRDFSIDKELQIIREYFMNITFDKRLTTLHLIEVLKYLNLDFLYIYDETCSTYGINPNLITYYTQVAVPTMSETQINKEITKEIYDEVNKKLIEENKILGI